MGGVSGVGEGGSSASCEGVEVCEGRMYVGGSSLDRLAGSSAILEVTPGNSEWKNHITQSPTIHSYSVHKKIIVTATSDYRPQKQNKPFSISIQKKKILNLFIFKKKLYFFMPYLFFIIEYAMTTA